MARRLAPARLYTDDEIRTSYRQAKHPDRQIKILADLNCCTPADIKAILEQEDENMGKSATDWDAIFAEIDGGAEPEIVAHNHGTTVAVINRTRGIRAAAAQKKTKESHSAPPQGKRQSKKKPDALPLTGGAWQRSRSG